MVGTIDQFRAQLIGGGARANQFKVEVLVPQLPGISNYDIRKASFLCKATSLPGQSLTEIAIPFRGRQIVLAGDREFTDPWQVTFLNDTDFAIRNAMEQWSNAINNLATGQGESNSLAYCADLTVSQLDKDDTILKQYKFINAWPLTISSIDLTTEAATAVEEFTVDFRYQHFLTNEVETTGASITVGISI
jgi:hypothetical protein|tara:strand:- start:659 stop:1231 length:573 start_codon:yes stop_codon:yes gene_type:complete